MHYTDRIPEYTIDLNRSEPTRWNEIIRKDLRVADALFTEALAGFTQIPGFNRAAGRVMKRLFRSLYRSSGGRYMGEMAAWAEALNRHLDDVLLLQCSYELSQAYEYAGSLRPFGCTAGVHLVPGLGMVHVRNMDWPLPSLGRATRIFRFINEDREFLTVGGAGMVGALSGMLPGQYSVTINYAPPSSHPRFGFGPVFLLREVLEKCDTYRDALAWLKNTDLSANVFFVLCGAKPGQACVIERTPKRAAIRHYRGVPMTHANHFCTRQLAPQNRPFQIEDEDGASVYHGSVIRKQNLATALKTLRNVRSIVDVASVLDVEDVCNEETHQQMVFCPARGEYAAWRSTRS